MRIDTLGLARLAGRLQAKLWHRERECRGRKCSVPARFGPSIREPVVFFRALVICVQKPCGRMNAMVEDDDIYWSKAEESLAGAVSEYANRRYNNMANRCYYGCFQAAIVALRAAGLVPPSRQAVWSHEQAQAVFAGELIARRKVYPAELRDVLSRLYLLREAADYKEDLVSELQARRALQRTRAFLAAVRAQGRTMQ